LPPLEPPKPAAAAPARPLPALPPGPYVTRGGRAGGGIKTFVEVTPAGLEVVERLAAEGIPMLGIAARLGIERSTLQEVRKRQPEVEEAVARGRASNEAELTSLLMDKCRSAASERDQLLAIFFALKVMHGYRDAGPLEGAASVTINQQINQFDRMTTGDIRARVTELLAQRDRLLSGGDAVDAEVVAASEDDGSDPEA
jgi:hypothetical protein